MPLTILPISQLLPVDRAAASTLQQALQSKGVDCVGFTVNLYGGFFVLSSYVQDVSKHTPLCSMHSTDVVNVEPQSASVPSPLACSLSYSRSLKYKNNRERY